jgi:putative ABC transport system substrate-binding protein
VTRIAVIRDPTYTATIGQFASIQSAASSALELSVIDPRDANDLKRALEAFAREPNGGLIVTGSASTVVHHELINSLALRHRLPGIQPFRYLMLSSGLASYGPKTIGGGKQRGRYFEAQRLGCLKIDHQLVLT